MVLFVSGKAKAIFSGTTQMIQLPEINQGYYKLHKYERVPEVWMINLFIYSDRDPFGSFSGHFKVCSLRY